jgi:ABC-type uncharacterized transport system ATPase subunit
MNPVSLLLDEVMAGLVPSEVQSLVGQVRQIRDGGVAIIIVEHVMRAITKLCDLVVMLRQGTVLAQGPAAVVLRDPRVIETYLGRRLKPPERVGTTAPSPACQVHPSLRVRNKSGRLLRRRIGS